MSRTDLPSNDNAMDFVKQKNAIQNLLVKLKICLQSLMMFSVLLKVSGKKKCWNIKCFNVGETTRKVERTRPCG